MFRWLKRVVGNVSDFIAGVMFTATISIVLLAGGLMGSLMCLFGLAPETEVAKQFRRGLVPA